MNASDDHDRQARNEALATLGKRLAIAAIPTLILAALAHGLGVPWWVIAPVIGVALYLVVFEA